MIQMMAQFFWSLLTKFRLPAFLLCVIGILVVACAIQTHRITCLKLQIEREKTVTLQAMLKTRQAHYDRLQQLARRAGQTTQQVYALKLSSERCQHEAFYQLANRIVADFNHQ